MQQFLQSCTYFPFGLHQVVRLEFPRWCHKYGYEVELFMEQYSVNESLHIKTQPHKLLLKYYT